MNTAYKQVHISGKGLLLCFAVVLFMYGCSGGKDQQPPTISLVENVGTNEGIPIYLDLLHLKTDAMEGLIALLTHEDYENGKVWSNDTYPIKGDGVTSIPLKKYESHIGQRLWVKAAAPAREVVIAGNALDKLLYSLVGVAIDQTKHYRVLRIEEDNRGKVYYFYYLSDPKPFIIQKKSSSSIVGARDKEVAGVFRFHLPPGFASVSQEKLHALKQTMLQGGEALARSSGTPDAKGYVLGDVVGYESSDGAYILTFVSKKERDKVRQEDVWKSNTERVEWGKNAGRLLSKSKVVTGQTIDGNAVLFTEIFDKSGVGRMQSYDIFVSSQPRYRHTVSLIHTKGEFKEQMVKDLLASMTIVTPSKY